MANKFSDLLKERHKKIDDATKPEPKKKAAPKKKKKKREATAGDDAIRKFFNNLDK